MNVKGIFKVLIVIVACVIIGAFVLNILLPNVTTSMVNTLEDMVYNATGLEFDWNGDGIVGGDGGSTTPIQNTNDPTKTGVQVEGFN